MADKRTYSDRAEYLKVVVSKRRRALRRKAVAYLGGKCANCGYDRCIGALNFHHEDPTKKHFGISANGFSRSWKSLQKELDKCVLLCANCHAEIHAGVTQPPSEKVE